MACIAVLFAAVFLSLSLAGAAGDREQAPQSWPPQPSLLSWQPPVPNQEDDAMSWMQQLQQRQLQTPPQPVQKQDQTEVQQLRQLLLQQQLQQPVLAQQLTQQSMLQLPQSLPQQFTQAFPQQFALTQQVQRGGASVNAQEFANMMKSKAGLEKELAESRAHEREAKLAREQDKHNAQQFAQLAQASVSQAQKSMEEENAVVEQMKKRIVAVETEKDELQGELYQAQQAMKKSAAERREWQAESQQLTKQLSQLWSRTKTELARLRHGTADEAARDKDKVSPQQPMPDNFVVASVEPPLPASAPLSQSLAGMAAMSSSQPQNAASAGYAREDAAEDYDWEAAAARSRRAANAMAANAEAQTASPRFLQSRRAYASEEY